MKDAETRTFADEAILEALAGGPLSTRELADTLWARVRDEWADEEGVDVDWDDPPVGAKLLAASRARQLGYALHPWETYPRLRRLEREGAILRLQIQGHRPILWRLA